MAGCLDNARMPDFEWLQVGDRRNLVASVVSGALVNQLFKEIMTHRY